MVTWNLAFRRPSRGRRTCCALVRGQLAAWGSSSHCYCATCAHLGYLAFVSRPAWTGQCTRPMYTAAGVLTVAFHCGHAAYMPTLCFSRVNMPTLCFSRVNMPTLFRTLGRLKYRVGYAHHEARMALGNSRSAHKCCQTVRGSLRNGMMIP